MKYMFKMNEKQFCSCCLAENCYKTMRNEYYNGDRKEIYGDMLFKTFNIKNAPCSHQHYICDKCIEKLREASIFRQQVIKAQEIIYKRLRTDKMQFKIEMDDEEFDDHVSDSFSERNFVWNDEKKQKGQIFVIKLEPKENNISEPATKKITSRKVSNMNIAKSKEETKKLRTEKVKTLKDITAKPMKTKPDMPPITQSEIEARENTLKILQNSNLCLFRSLRTKFGCFTCKTTFLELSKLREHTTTHTNTNLLAYRVSRWRGLSYKNADISDLQCNRCSEKITDLTELINHLKNKHEVSFPGSNHFLIPYKLSEGNQCVICDAKFNTFLRLSMHMNCHYTNNVCEICGHPFINRLSLRMHMQSMHKEKKCALCPANFLTLSSKVKHMKKVHNIFSKKRYCNSCDKTFEYTYLLAKHKIKEHGAKTQVFECRECGKTFLSDSSLRIHTRSVHIKERNYPCSICSMRFFTKCDVKRHERIHDDVRSFSCSYCDAKFKSKDSWRRHMKRQHGHAFT